MNTLIGLFQSKEHADMAVDALKDMGIPGGDISVIMRKGEQDSIKDDVAAGATTGGVIGGIAGLLVGIGVLTLPGIGAILAGGPLISALGLSGAAATAASTVAGGVSGAVAGGIIGGLVGFGLSEDDARLYERKIREGAILVAVSIDDENERGIKEIFARHHASEIKTLKAKQSSSARASTT